MKKVTLLIMIVLSGYSLLKAQSNAKYCTWKASLSNSDIKPLNKLVIRTTNKLQVDVDNKGTCTWEEDVYMKVSLDKFPTGLNRSKLEDVFDVDRKIKLNNPYVTGGGTGRFVAKFDAVEVAGLYLLKINVYDGKNKEMIKQHSVLLKYTD